MWGCRTPASRRPLRPRLQPRPHPRARASSGGPLQTLQTEVVLAEGAPGADAPSCDLLGGDQRGDLADRLRERVDRVAERLELGLAQLVVELPAVAVAVLVELG